MKFTPSLGCCIANKFAKRIAAAVFCTVFECLAFARGRNELVEAGSWIYDAMAAIALEQGRLDFTGKAPLSVGEIRFFLEEADYGALSEAGRVQYDRVEAYCNHEALGFGSDVIRLAFEVEVNGEGYYKQNDDLEWVYGRYDKGDFLYVPVKIEGGDCFTMMMEAKLALNNNTQENDDNYTSVPLAADEIDINFPDIGYFSTSKTLFDGKAIAAFKIGKGSSDFSRTLTGSIVQSRYFTGSSYAELSFYAKNFRYAMMVDEFNVDKYFYSHEVSMRFFKKLTVTLREALLVYSSMELRYLNPWTIFHGFAAWRDYGSHESNTCDYLGINMSYAPIKFLRVYGEFAMTQFQTPYETSNYSDDVTPNGLGFQGGVESFLPHKGGYWHFWLEGTYTQPYLYIKESPDWSLVRNYRENLGDTKYVFYEWLGSPYGPDTVAGKLSVEYEKPGKWSLGASYLLKVGGLNSGTKVFDDLDWHEGDEYVIDDSDEGAANRANWAYPDTDAQGEEEASSRQDASTPSGVNEYVNVISLFATWSPRDNVTFSLQPSYVFVFNYYNESGRNESGFEIAFSTKIKVF